MPSFLSKVFGRKKDDKESPRVQGRASDASLLGGKFEAVSPTISPTINTFPDGPMSKGGAKEKEKELPFGLFKAKSRSSLADPSQKPIEAPHLSLNLPGPKEGSNSRALGVVFETDPESHLSLADSILGERRLNPLETLILVRACSQAIAARGLETLGVMHPHWYSSSPDIQRRLVSLFIQSLAPKSPITTLSPTPTAAVSAFESEINFTRSPHDVAAVLRWGLRHLQLEGNSFGKTEDWYDQFFEAERASDYPPQAFSQKLAPEIPPSHLELLTATLEILSSLAAHAEMNGISGSKLSMFFGLWLLTSQRAHEKDSWESFYARWERNGRILEHLFLCPTSHRMPTRLLELVHQYPYNRGNTTQTNEGLLPRPRFSTRTHEALFVRIETELPNENKKPANHPLRLLAQAFEAEHVSANTDHSELWQAIQKAVADDESSSPGEHPKLGRIFTDETIRLLSMTSSGVESGTAFSSALGPATSPRSIATRRRSFSLGDTDKAVASAAANGTTSGSNPSPGLPQSTSTPLDVDWGMFSTSGFGETSSAATPLASTLLDKDVLPFVAGNGRKSLDVLPSAATATSSQENRLTSKTTVLSRIQLDEGFIDFWNDALSDPITSNWPAFVVCQLKNSIPGLDAGMGRLEWLVIEQFFKRPNTSPTTPASQATVESTRRSRASSPRPSFKSDISGTFSSTRKRFSFFSAPSPSIRTSQSSADKSAPGKKKAAKVPQIGEMGEILAEEDERADTIRVRVPSPKPRKSVDIKKSIEVPKTQESRLPDNPPAPASTAGAVATAAALATPQLSQPGKSEPVSTTTTTVAVYPRDNASGAAPTAPDSGDILDTSVIPPNVDPAYPTHAHAEDAIAGSTNSDGTATLGQVDSTPSATENPVRESPSNASGSSTVVPNGHHMEPINAPAEDLIDTVSLPPVPVVEADIRIHHIMSAAAPPVEMEGEASVDEFDKPVTSEIVSPTDAAAGLPPTPYGIVSAGETPGPQVALSTSEVATTTSSAEADVPPKIEHDDSVVNTHGDIEPLKNDVMSSPPLPAQGPLVQDVETTPALSSQIPPIHATEEPSDKLTDDNISDAPAPDTRPQLLDSELGQLTEAQPIQPADASSDPPPSMVDDILSPQSPTKPILPVTDVSNGEVEHVPLTDSRVITEEK
ncbi:hypothetical protein BD779DRAFT_1673610 [Infundibulicybe gibba]|nr:hypothetical protein BD779DRAFT_1673610 [Infundibulicybe gibba]